MKDQCGLLIYTLDHQCDVLKFYLICFLLYSCKFFVTFWEKRAELEAKSFTIKKTFVTFAPSYGFLREVMGKYSLYKVPLRSLSEGKSRFDYNLDDKYFRLLDDGSAEIKKGSLNVVLDIKKANNTFEMNFAIEGNVNIPCDRCLDDIQMEVDTKNRLIVKYGREYSEESDEIVIIPEEDGEINIAWFLYEFVLLSIPIKRVHASGECNKAMSSKLKKYKALDSEDDNGGEDDFEDDDSENAAGDSRWDTLKDLKFEDN